MGRSCRSLGTFVHKRGLVYTYRRIECTKRVADGGGARVGSILSGSLKASIDQLDGALGSLFRTRNLHLLLFCGMEQV